MKLVLLTLITLFSFSGYASYQFVVNSGTGVSAMSKAEMKNVLTGATGKIGSQKAQVIIPESGAAIDAAMSDIGMTLGEFEQAWLEKALSGGGTPPEKKSSDAAVIDAVKSNPGGVGIVGDGAQLDGVTGVTLN